MKQITDLELVVQYILDCEYEDFEENPSQNHIYYIALKISCGELEAREILNDAINKE